jgi:Trm5-related predicted tRNA methylase
MALQAAGSKEYREARNKHSTHSYPTLQFLLVDLSGFYKRRGKERGKILSQISSSPHEIQKQ